MSNSQLEKVAILGNYLPRQCGIATFTTDLSTALRSKYAELDLCVLAMNDRAKRYNYPAVVRFELEAGDIESFRRAADFLNMNTVDVLSVQHEYGIFGGSAGSHVLTLLREMRMPIVTTLHTVLAEPNSEQRVVMDEITQLSERIVVMSHQGSRILQDIYKIRDSQIDIIPHGVRDITQTKDTKDKIGVHGKSVILTFGLLSPDKGIEYVIDALPAILAKQPNVVYIVVGATHPHVKERSGETYRTMLENRAHRLGVDANIIFHNRFVSDSELAEFMAAADIYVTPYLKQEQITSGALAYAIGSGKVTVSTPYLYAREMLSEGRGVLVPWRDHVALSTEIGDLLSNDKRREALSRAAAAQGRLMQWPAVAKSYMHSFMRARDDHASRRHSIFEIKTLAKRLAELPDINLQHVQLMTDDTGMLQHACFCIPRYDDGYCLDDNARALMLTALLEDSSLESMLIRSLASRYLAFVNYSFNHETGRFKNLMSYSRAWLEDCGSEDSHARALRALGAVVGRSQDPGRQTLAGSLFHDSLAAAATLSSARAWASSLLGIAEYLRAFQGDTQVQSIQRLLADRLLGLFVKHSSADWPWFEDALTYDNAALSQALIVSGHQMNDDEMLNTGLRSLTWLELIQRSEYSYFSPIGSNGFYRRGGQKALFDQQPIEACGMVSACLEAMRVTGDDHWLHAARRAFNWFLGQNHLQLPLYDSTSGGCRDGLHVDRVNENQGAESTLCFLLALAEMRSVDKTSVKALQAKRNVVLAPAIEMKVTH